MGQVSITLLRILDPKGVLLLEQVDNLAGVSFVWLIFCGSAE